MTVSDLNPGQCGVVHKIEGCGPIKRRIIDMGITPGTTITMKKTAPFGDPIEVKVRGYNLSIRRSEALSIIIFNRKEKDDWNKKKKKLK